MSQQLFLHSGDHLVTGSGNTEHPKGMLEGCLMSLDAGSRTAITQGIDSVPPLVGLAHSRLDATICQEPPEDDVLDAVLTKQEVEVGGVEAAKTTLALDNEVAGSRLHAIAESAAPLASLEGLAFLNRPKDTIGVVGNLLVPFLERDGNVDDSTSCRSTGIHKLLAVGDGTELVEAGLHGIVEGAAIGCELILEFN